MTGLAATGMRVVCIASFMNHAGAQEALVRLAGLLRERGHEVEVWFLYEETPAYRDEPGVRVILPVKKPTAWGYATITARLLRALARTRPDAVISFLPLANILGQAAAFALGVPVRVASQRTPSSALPGVNRRLDRALGTLGVYTANVAVSRSCLDSFESYPTAYRRRMAIVHNGIVWRSSALARPDARRKFGLPADKPVVLAVGRMTEAKNYPFLIRLFAQLPGAVLAIAGDGRLRVEMEGLARELGVHGSTVLFLGNVDRRDIADLLRAADLFIQPSLFEGQSNSLLEAMHEGLPVVVSDIPAQAETVRFPDGTVAGVLLPLSDEARWAPEIAALLADPVRRAGLGRLAQRRAAAFSAQAMADGFERALRWRGAARPAPAAVKDKAPLPGAD